MNKDLSVFKLCVIAFIAIGIYTSCDNDFDLTADKVEIPIVYALLDASDTAQYFRVERAFIDEDIPAATIAQRPDSLYYEDAIVKIIRQSTGDEYVMQRVDGNDEGYPRQEGIFATVPNYLYKIRTSDIILEPEEIYELVIELGDGLDPITATTTFIKPPFLSTPVEGMSINIDPKKVINYKWNDNATNAIFDVDITFLYDEQSNTGSESKEIVWSIVSKTTDNEAQADNSEFFSILANTLDPIPGVTRKQRGARFTLISGGIELADYIRIGQANLGITSSGEIPLYEGSLSYGYGLFSSRHTEERGNLSLTPVSLDSLVDGSVTGDLGFIR